MRALITGASGFVGRHLRTHLVAMGDEVHTTDRRDGGPDLGDTDAVTALFADVDPDVVYHLAGQSDVGASWHDPMASVEANTVGTAVVLLAARRTGVGRVLAVTSADVYGQVAEDDLPLDEHAPLLPVSPYAASKAAADMLCLQAHLGFGQDVVRIRAFNHLGPGQNPNFVAPALASRIVDNERTGGEIVPVGNLSPRRDFTDVRDVARAYRLLADRATPGEVYNVCSGRSVAVSDIAERLVALAVRPMRLDVDPALVRPVDLPVLRGDNQRLTAATGWSPEYDLDRTLADLLDDYRDRASAPSPRQEHT